MFILCNSNSLVCAYLHILMSFYVHMTDKSKASVVRHWINHTLRTTEHIVQLMIYLFVVGLRWQLLHKCVCEITKDCSGCTAGWTVLQILCYVYVHIHVNIFKKSSSTLKDVYSQHGYELPAQLLCYKNNTFKDTNRLTHFLGTHF